MQSAASLATEATLFYSVPPGRTFLKARGWTKEALLPTMPRGPFGSEMVITAKKPERDLPANRWNGATLNLSTGDNMYSYQFQTGFERPGNRPFGARVAFVQAVSIRPVLILDMPQLVITGGAPLSNPLSTPVFLMCKS